MGYTHYWYRTPHWEQEQFEKVATDFKKMVPILQRLGVKLAGGGGADYPIITPTEIRFNGLSKCGHTQRELGITWPAEKAKGVEKNGVDTILGDIVQGHWFAGAKLESRVCGGDCSHETFSLEAEYEFSFTRPDGSVYTKDPIDKVSYVDQHGQDVKEEDNHVGRFFDCTKTAYKPYDLAVNVCLIIAKQYLKHGILVTSDGEDEHWDEGRQLCQHFLGYGEKFKLDDGSKHRRPTKNHKHDLDRFGWCKGCGCFVGRESPTMFKMVTK